MSCKIAIITDPIKAQPLPEGRTKSVSAGDRISDEPYYKIDALASLLDISEETVGEIQDDVINNKGDLYEDSRTKVCNLVLKKLEKLNYNGDYSYKDAFEFAIRRQDIVSLMFNKRFQFYLLLNDIIEGD